MKLRDKFLPIVYRIAQDKENEKRAESCEQIAEDFAIGFYEWRIENIDQHTNKEAMEIYKKEKVF